MHGADNGSFDSDMASGYFEKPPSRARPLIGFRAPEALKDKLEALEQLWKIRAQVDADQKLATTKFRDAAEREKLLEKVEAEIKAIDFTYVCNRLMKLAADEALSETLRQVDFDHVPRSDDEWAKVRTAFVKSSKAHKP